VVVAAVVAIVVVLVVAMVLVVTIVVVLAVVDRLCGLLVRVSGYRYRGPGYDPRRYQIF